MANGGKGAVGKIYIETAVVDNFKQIAGQIKSGLGNGLKDLKDLELPFNFNEKDFAQAASAELQSITKLLGTSKLSKLDYSSIIPTLTNALSDDALGDSIKYQIVQGFRQGLETANEMLTSSNLIAIQQKTGQSTDKTLAAIGGYSAINDIISSFGLNKGDSKLLAKNYNKAAGWVINGNTPDAQKKARKQTAQLMALKDVQDAGYEDVLRYLVDVNSSASQLSESHMMKLAQKEELTKNDAQKVTGILERLKYLTENGSDESRAEAKLALGNLNRSTYLSQILKQIEQNPKLTQAAVGIKDSVRKASEFKDTAYQHRKDEMFLDGRHPMTILTEFAERISGMESVYNKIAPLLARDIPATSPFSVDKMFEETIRSMKANQELEAKRILVAEASKQSIGEPQIGNKMKKTGSMADSVEKISEEIAVEEKPESSIKTWKDLEKAEKEYDKLRDKIVSTWQEVETLYKQINEAQQKADESRIRYKNLKDQQSTKENEVNTLSERKRQISERLEDNKDKLNQVETDLREIQDKRKELKFELKKYNDETKALYESEAFQNREANIQRQKEISDERLKITNKMGKINQKELPELKKIIDAKNKPDDEDSALEFLKQKAEKMKENNAEYKKTLAFYEKASGKKKELLSTKLEQIKYQSTLSQAELLKAFQNAKEQGVDEKQLLPFMENPEEDYGFNLKVFKKDGTFMKKADEAIRKQLDPIIESIKQTIKKKEAEVKALHEKSERLRLEAKDLNAEISNAGETSQQREAGAAKIQKEIDALDTKENSKITTRKRLRDSIEQDENLLNEPRYASLEETKKKVAESKEIVEKAKQEADEAQKELTNIQKTHRKRKNELIDMGKSQRDLRRDIEIGQTNLLTEEIETRTASDTPKTRSRKKDVLEKRHEDLENKRKQLEEEIKKDNDVLAISETKQKELNRSIEQTVNEQESNKQKQAESKFNLQNYDNAAKESEKKLKEAETKLAALRERQEQLVHEKEEFDAETERLMSQKAFKKNIKISNEIRNVEKDIKGRQDSLAILTQDAEQMGKTLKATPEKRPLALDELKEAAKANKEAQDELREIEILLTQGEFESPEDEKSTQERYKTAKEKSVKAYAAYINAIENATESKTPYNYLERYTGKTYDPDQVVSPEHYFMYQQFGTFALEKDLLEPFKELQNLLDERNKQIEQAQKEIDEQENKIGELQKKLSKGWQDVNPEERKQQSAEKQAEIDRIATQKEALENQQSDAQSNLDTISELSKNEQSTLDNLKVEGTNLDNKLAELKEKETKEVEAYKQLKEIRDEKKRRLERVQADEDLLKQAEEEIAKRLQDKSKEKSPTQEQEESVEDNPIVEQADKEVIDAEEVTKAIEERKKELEGKIKELNSLIESFPSEDDYRKFYDTDSAKTYNEPARATENPASAAMKQLRERGSAFKQTIKDIKAQEKEMKSMDKESAEYKKAEENLQRLQDQYVRDWVSMYYAHEELGGWGIESGLGSEREQQTYNKWVPERQGDKKHPFSEENLKMMLERIQEQKKRKIQLEIELARYQEELKSLTEEEPQEELVEEPVTPEPAPTTESTSGQPEAIAEETEEITEEGEAIVEGLQHEEEALNEAAEEIHEERERVEQARENFDEEVNSSRQGETQPSTPTTTSQPDTTPQEGGEQVKPEVEVAEKETGEVQKSREDLEDERNKLQDEIRKSDQIISDAENRMAEIDRDIEQTQQTKQRNSDTIDRLTKKKAQIESQIQQTKDELKTIKERLQDAVDAKQAAEDEIKKMEEQLLNAGDSNIVSVDTPENANKYNELKEQIDNLAFEQDKINRPVVDNLTQKKKSLEDILNQDYSVKTMDEAYKQAMQRKKDYLEKTKKYAKAIEETEKYEIGSAEWMIKMADVQPISAEQDAAWMAYYKSMQEFESHGKESNSKITKRKRLYSGISSMEMPTDENAEVILSNLQEYLDQLHEKIVEREKTIKTTQEELDRLQQKMDELSSHLVTTEDISKQLEGKKQEQQKFKQEEDNWTAQQTTKQTELDDLNEQLNGTKGVANHLKAVQDSHQNNQEELQQLKQQREEQQHIYDTAKAIQQEKKKQLAELNELINETGSEEQPPSQKQPTKQDLEQELANLTQQLDQLEKEDRELNARSIELDRKRASRDMRGNSHASEREAINEELDGVTARQIQIRDEIGDLKKLIEEKRKALQALSDLEAPTPQSESPASDTKPSESSKSPLSSSGVQTADGVQQEGNEADDAASKMKALADAKKEALEANQQLAESANITQEAISAESSAGDFNTLILALTEIYELLSQLPQSFEGFKGFDLSGFTEPLNGLSQAIQQLPKEGFNISLGDSFDNLANRINEVLQKIQELTSQAKTAEIESNIAEKYDGQIKQLNEQINQLKVDAEEAKKALEELKKTQQDVGQTTSIKKEEKQIDPLSQIDKQLAKEYDNLQHAQDKLFTTTNVSEYNSALENVENTLQRIRQLEQDIVSQYAGQSQTDYLLMGYGDDPIDTLSNRLPESTKARNEAQSSTKQLAKEYIEQQKAEIKTLVDSLKTINIIPEDTQSNWGKKRREEYAQITEGAQAASQAIDMLNASLESMETNGANSAILKNFLELKESTAQMVKDVQDKNNVFGDDIQAASVKLIERLSDVEERLQIIKRDSGKLINIDPALAGALATIEKHLNKIHDLKNTVSKDPLQAINPQFTRSANSYLAQMEGKGKSKSVVEGLEQTSARSQTDFKRITTNYNSYATALKKLFDDMSKGAGVSLKQLEEDLSRVNELATKLANSTGLERNNLLTGELNSKADPQIADTQAKAANKVAVAYETMYTKIESKAKEAQSTIENIFGTDGISAGLDTKFVGGNVEGFDDFVQNANQAGEALKRLREIQDSIRDDKNWVTQEENVKEYTQTLETLNESLKQVAENASKFSVTDELDVQKLRASTTQFIKDNPALSGGDISQLEKYIDQLQGKINDVDFTTIKNGIESVKQTAIEAGRTGDTFFSMLTQRFKSLGAYLLSFVSFYEVVGVFKEGINIIHELDDALTEMQKVSNESLSSLQEYQRTTFDTANKIGTTAAQLQQSTADWMRLGEDLQSASQSAQTANVLFNVSEFDSIDEATTALVAMSAAYADAEKNIDKMDIVDRLNLIGNNYAIATDELATALQDGAATLQTAGNDLDQAIALTTAGNLITQDASKTGKGIRTIALRLTGTKEAAEELEEMGEDTSDMIMSQSKMRDLIMNATKVASNNYKGFDIQDELGRYKSTYEIMLGLAQIWDEIQQADFKTGDNRQNLLLESIAGKNRASIAASILQNPDVLQSVYEDSSTKSAGSALKENEKVLQSITGHLARLKNAWQEMWANAANRDVINGFIDLGTKIVELINDAGLLKSAFAVLFGGTIIKGLTNANSLLVKYVQLLTQTKSLSSVLTEIFSSIFNIKLEGWEAIKQAWSNRGQAPTTAPTQPQTDTYQPNAYDDAINAQLMGQNAALDENTQKKRENAQAQRELTEATNEGVVSSAASTEQQTAETAANMENAASSQEQAASELDEATAKLENTAATEGLNTAEQQEANVSAEATSANIAQAESEILEATNKMAGESTDVFDVLTEAMEGVGGAAVKMGGDVNNGVGHSIGLFSKLGGSLETLKAGFISFMTSPSVLLLAIPAAIFAYNKAVGDYNKHQRELIDQAHQASNAWSDTQKSVQDYATKYSDLKSQLENTNLSEQETIDIKKQIYDLQTQITDQYGESASGLDLINGKLEQQLGIIQNISQEEAKRTYGSNREAYERAIGEMNREQNYTINTQGLSQEEIANLFEGIDYEAELDFVTGDETAKTFKNVDQAEEYLNTLNDRLLTIKESMTEGEWAASKYAKVYDDVSKAISANNDVIAENRADAKAGLETQLLMAGDSTGRDLQKDYKTAVDAYNQALITGTDTSKIEEAQKKVQDLQEQIGTFLQGDNAKYSPLFKDIDDSINTSLQDVFNLRQRMRSEEGQTIIESAFGKIKDNKKNAKEINDELIETAQHVVDMQRQANEWGVIDNLNPITGTAPKKTKYGNIDLNNRQVLEWNKDTISQFKDAWDSYNQAGWNWGEMPEVGDISTVLGGSNEFQGVEIAFSPVLQGEDGKPVLLSHDSLTTYLDAVVHSATDQKTGKVNLDEIIKIDGDPKRGGKKLIAAVGKAGDEAVIKLGNSMHFMGKDGALASGMRDLAHMAREANIPIKEVMNTIQQTGNTSALEDMLRNTVVTASDVQDALMGADGTVNQLLADLAGDFGITMETPEDQIQAFINQLAEMGYVAAESTQSSQSSLDHFFADTSARIETLTNLTSVIQKGQSQTGLTFTKTLDENKNEVASEVKSIVDAYKTLDGFDLGSLFEETGTGIKLNYDAYRALAQEEEAEVKRQYKLERAALEAQLATAPSDQQDRIKQQIVELDMLSSAYDGVTSALSKYLNQQNAADYGDTYSMLQGTTLKRGDELLNKGLIGTEEFRSIAQLFSFESLATADSKGVVEAYKTGAANVRKYFTEDAVQGVYQFATDIEQLPEKFGKIAKSADGAFTFDLTDEQLDNLAEHFQVSTDVIEAFFDQIRATGGEVHIWRDGGYEDFDNLNKNIDESKEKLQELKEKSNDPNLIPDDAFNWDASSIDTVDEIKKKIEDMKNIQAKIGDPDMEAWQEAQKIIDDLEKKLQGYEEAERNARNTSPITVESYQEANEIVNQINDGLLEMQNLEDQDIKVSVEGKNGTTPSQTLQELADQIYQLPDEIQEYVMIEAGLEWHEGMTPEEIKQQFQGEFETTRITVEADTTEAENQIDNLNTGTETAVTSTVDLDTTQAEEKANSLIAKLTEPITGLFVIEAQADEVDNVKKDVAEPVEVEVNFVPKNTVQDAVNQAGGNQPAVVNQQTTTTETVNHVENYTANTSGLEEAQSALSSLHSQSGSVNVDISVTGDKKIADTQTKLNQLAQKAKGKVNVVINGNNSTFLKSYNDTISKLNEIAKKDTTAKIKGDNSNLKDKVSEAKSKLNSIDDKKVHITASATGDFDKIANWKTNTFDHLGNKEIKVHTTYSYSGDPKMGKGSGFQGSAHNQGTIMSNGHAYASGTLSGDWGLPKAEKGALINELGSEIVVTPDGHWQILNSGDPTFVNLPKGAIIFNHKQTESLLKKGYVNGSHGKIIGGAFASGTVDDEKDFEDKAFATGTVKWNNNLSGNAYDNGYWKPPTTSTSNGGGDKGGGNEDTHKHKHKHKDTGKDKDKGKTNNANKSAKEFLQTLDTIEIQLQRVDAELQRLDTNANKTFGSFKGRGNSFAAEISIINKEIERLNKSLKTTNKNAHGGENSYASYLAKAEAAAKAAGIKAGEDGASYSKRNVQGQGLSEYWTDRIKNGVNNNEMLTIDDVGNEGLWKKIQAYQTWYEKYVKLSQKRQEYINRIAQLTISDLQLVQKSYESYLNLVAEQANTNQQLIEAQTALTKNDTLNLLNKNIQFDKTRISTLKEEKKALEERLKQAVDNKIIKKNSEEWRTWMANIQKIDTQLQTAENDIVAQTDQKLEYVQTRWQATLDLLDTSTERYNTLIERQGAKQSITPKTYKKGKNKGKLQPTTSKNDNVLKYYKQLNEIEKARAADLRQEYKQLNAQLKKAVANKRIQKGSLDYKKWQTELRNIQNQILETGNTMIDNVISQLEHVQEKWETILDTISTKIDIVQSKNELREEKGYAASAALYRQEIGYNKQRRKDLVRERADLRNQLYSNLTVKVDKNGNPKKDKKGKTIANPEGTIVIGSQEYYKQKNAIDQITNNILETDKAIVGLKNDIRQLDWDKFERTQERISNASGEAEFLNGLINENDLFTKKGRITKKGRASEGLIAQQYDLEMKNAQQYGKKMRSLNKQLAKDPHNLDLIKQRDEWLKAQQQSIENAHKQKEAMADLIEKGIKKQIEAMSKLISKYNEALDAQRSQEQYAKSIADRQKRINSLQKQLKAMGSDDSEEGRARRQQLKDEIKNARQDLKDAQEDKRTSDIKEMLSTMQEKYEETLNARLDNIDKLFSETITSINQHGKTIADTIKSVGTQVGYDITTVLKNTYNGVKNVKNNNEKGSLVSDTNNKGQFKNSDATTVAKTPEATKKNGTYTENGKKVYYYNDKKQSGFFNVGKNKRYADPKTGTLAKGWKTIGKSKYYFDKNGNMVTGLQTIGKQKYYFSDKGVLHTTNFETGGKYYQVDKTGKITSISTAKIGGAGTKTTTPKKGKTTTPKKGKNTTTPKKGKTTTTPKADSLKTGTSLANLLKNPDPTKKTTTPKKPVTTTPKKPVTTTPKKSTTTTTKKVTTPNNKYRGLWKNSNTGLVYFYNKGKVETGWQNMKEGKRYFSAKDGHMMIGVATIAGKQYLFGDNGVLRDNYTGLYKQKTANDFHPANTTFYLKKGVVQTGWHNMNEGRRYFSNATGKKGRMLTGMQIIGGASYYLDPKTGVAKTGNFTLNKVKYVADKNGKITKKNGVAVKGHLAKGTPAVQRKGLYRVDEEGNEVFINKSGKIYTRLDKGTTVLPHDAALNLLKGMSNPVDFISKNMDMRPNTTTTNNSTGDTTNYITFNMSGVQNYREFMREAQKDPNFTKYIQEISIGKLNGHNSLKKNAIRFA